MRNYLLISSQLPNAETLQTLPVQKLITTLAVLGFVFSVEAKNLRCINIDEKKLPEELWSVLQNRERELLEFFNTVDFPLSFVQRQLWFLNQYEVVKSASYNVPLLFKLSGALNVTILKRSFAYLIARHEILRTVFKEQQGKVVQHVLATFKLDFTFHKISLENLDATLVEYASIPFDLEQGSLLRVHVFATQNYYVLLLNQHHIITDGWSVKILLYELSEIYNSLITQTEPDLTLLKIKYRDVCLWQQDLNFNVAFKKQCRYWQDNLTGIERLNLITDYKRPAIQTYRGARKQFVLDAEIAAQLNKIAKAQRCTLFMSLLTAFYILLYRYSGQNNIVVGIPVTGRKHKTFYNILGPFINTLVLRCDLNGDKSIIELLSEVRKLCLAAYDNQDVPFGYIVDLLKIKRDPSISPLFQVMFEVHTADQIVAPKFSNIEAEPLTLNLDIAKFDLTLSLIVNHDEILGEIEYNTNLFALATIRRMIRHYVKIVKEIITNNQVKVDELSLLSAAEFKQIVYGWNKTLTLLPKGMFVRDLFERQVQKTSNNLALLTAEQGITYKQLNLYANNVARLCGENFRACHYHQPRIGILLKRDAKMFISLIGVLKTGAVFIPLAVNDPRKRLKLIIKDAGIEVLLTTKAIFVTKSWLKEAVYKVIFIDVCMDVNVAGCDYTLEIFPQSLAYILYTSGSTGTPKGVMLTQQNFLNAVFARLCEFAKYPKPAKFLSIYELTFDAALAGLFWVLLRGGCFVISKSNVLHNPNKILNLIQAEQITHFDCTPGFYHSMLNQVAVASKIESLQVIIVGGETCLEQVRYKHFQKTSAHLINEYGSTETCIWAAYKELNGKTKRISIGRGIKNTYLYVLNAALKPQPVGVPGELYIGGLSVAAGYLNNLELTASKFIENPFEASLRQGSSLKGEGYRTAKLYKTGDLVRWTCSGELEFLGRSDEQLKIRGIRIQPEEIVAALNTHNLIIQSYVTAEEINGSLQLIAYAHLLEGPWENDASYRFELKNQLQQYLRASLPNYLIPLFFVFLKELPRMATGKIAKLALPKVDVMSCEKHHSNYVKAQTDIEILLVRIWQRVLNCKTVGVHDNFFSLGGDSIMSIQVISQAREKGLNLSSQQLFTHPTIYELARIVDIKSARNEFNVESMHLSMQNGKNKKLVPLTPIQQWFFSQDLPVYNHYNQALFLRLDVKLKTITMQKILDSLAERHTSLRLRFQKNLRKNVWQQYYVESLNCVTVLVHKINANDLILTNQCITELCEEAQSTLDITNGPIAKFIVFSDMAENCRYLFIVAHHLIIDYVSWRILLDDLVYLIRAGDILKQKTLKSNGYSNWSNVLHKLFKSSDFAQDFLFWQKKLQLISKDLNHKSRNPIILRQVKNCHVVFTADLTANLLRKVNQVYQTNMNEILLTALLIAYCQWQDKTTLVLDLETHGREIFDIKDIETITNTIGWFTCIYPVILNLPSCFNKCLQEIPIASVIKAIQAQLRAIPHKGISYGILRYLGSAKTRKVLSAFDDVINLGFNYLGQIDLTDTGTGEKIFHLEARDIGTLIAPENYVAHILEINGFICSKKLQFDFYYSNKHYSASEIAQFCELFKKNLESVILHCSAKHIHNFIPKRFPFVKLTSAAQNELSTTIDADIEDIYPLSPLQKGLLFHALYDRHTDQYCNQLSWDYRGEIDQSILKNAWQKLVRRYAVLRSSFVQLKNHDEPLQIIHKNIKLKWFFKDLGGISAKAREEFCLKYAEADYAEGFNLETPGLFKLRLLCMARNHYRFLWTDHHLILDGWSTPLLFSEVHKCYQELLMGKRLKTQFKSQQIPQYRDYLIWLKQQNISAAQNFWRQFLREIKIPSSLGINSGKLDIYRATSNFLETDITLSITLSNKCRNFAKQTAVTLNNILQLAFAKVIACYSGDDTVIFGVTVSGRPSELPNVDKMVGLFINTIPLRVDFIPNQNVNEALKILHFNMQQVDQFSYLDLNAIQKVSSINAGLPLFYSLLIFENYPITDTVYDISRNLRITNVKGKERTNYPLTIEVSPQSAALVIKAIYDAESFTKNKIMQLLQHIEQLLIWMTDNPYAELSRARILTKNEYQQIIYDWNNTTETINWSENYYTLFIKQVLKTPDNIAVIYKEEKLNYRELADKATIFADNLEKVGVNTGELVCLYLDRSIDFLVAILAIFKIGAAYLPLSSEYPLLRNLKIILQSRIKFIITDANLSTKLTQMNGVDNFDSRDLRLINYSEFCESNFKETNIAEKHQNYFSTGERAYVIYTSGSTGSPKGVVITQMGMLNHLRAKIQDIKLSANDIIVQNASQCFDISVWQFLAALLVGGTTFIIPDEIIHDAYQLLEAIDARGATILEIVPSMLQMFLEEFATKRHGGQSYFPNLKLRWLILTGEALQAKLCSQWFYFYPKIPLFNAYGPTECADDVTHFPIYVCSKAEGYMPIGKPIINIKLYVLDKYLQPLPIGIPGELYVSGIGVSSGYLHDENQTRRAFFQTALFDDESLQQRFYKTGDIVKWLADGNLEYIGRKNSQIKIRGFRIEIGEIETVLLQNPKIKTCVVNLIEGDNYNSEEIGLCAYIVLYTSVRATATELKEYLQKSLPDYMIPKFFTFLEKLPLSVNGKIARKLLPRPNVQNGVGTSIYVSPQGFYEIMLAEIWSEVFKRKRSGRNEHFYRCGGDSLTAMRLASKIHARHNLKLPIKVILQNPILKDLAKEIEKFKK